MAAKNPCDTHLRLAVVSSDGGGVPVSFPLGNDGVALVTSIRLSLRFQMSEDFMFIDEEVYDAQSGDLTYTISQSPVCDGASKQWLLNAMKYRVYGVLVCKICKLPPVCIAICVAKIYYVYGSTNMTRAIP
jgi:hypothetical protein